jgi:hypothetical protein
MTISTPMATVTDMIEKNITLTATAIMIDNGATTGVPVITITVKTGTGMTGKIAVPDVTMTATMIATAAGATTTGALCVTVTSFAMLYAQCMWQFPDIVQQLQVPRMFQSTPLLPLSFQILANTSLTQCATIPPKPASTCWPWTQPQALTLPSDTATFS